MTTEVLSGNFAHGHEHEHHDAGSNKIFGFWIYLMSDCILFAAMFATYSVQSHSFAGGPSGKELFELPFVFVETMLLLVSSLTFGLSVLALRKGNKTQVIAWITITFLLGAGFIGMEIYEFHHLIAEGNGPNRSGFLSAFFTLVGLHGLHVTCGLIWMAVMILQVVKKGLKPMVNARLMCLSLFWHFLDIVWIGVFTIVYLMGVL